MAKTSELNHSNGERAPLLPSQQRHATQPLQAFSEHSNTAAAADGSGGGALRPGRVLQLYSTESLGLLAQYAAVGLVFGTLPNTITPFLTYYLNMEGTATTSARALLFIPWSLKVFIGMLSDCVPIFGYRRRPYMAFGWAVTAVCLFIMALLPPGAPYFPDPALRHVKPESYTPAQLASLNKDAPSHGGVYIVLMMFATLGYLFADVASDAVVVEYAQREPLATRGRTQTLVYSVRYLFGIVAQVITGFGLSSPEYGGDFDFGISFPATMFLLAVFCMPVAPMTWFFIREERVAAPVFRDYLADLWRAIQSRAVYQVIGYTFLSTVFFGFSYVAADPITSYWVRATSLNLSLSGIVGTGATVATFVAMGKYGLDWSWRTIQVVTTLTIVALDAVCTMCVTWDVVRSQWFWLGAPVVEAIPTAMSVIISTYIVVELADCGNEAAIYGLVSTVTNLGAPFALTLTTSLNAPFQVHNDDILNDSHDVRRDVTITILLAYAMKLLSLAFLPLLPRQKAETQELKRSGGSSRAMGAFTITYLSFAVLWSVAMNLESVFASSGAAAGPQ